MSVGDNVKKYIYVVKKHETYEYVTLAELMQREKKFRLEALC